ncbi:RNA-directed DNA polymerase, eukaryota, Reverse transcriptase zinc-binding domain protein [Artemisia annua]|uniref:RNA-directed DNA polymerase, eukaryota, Reverse transcriptase zinc-binding domain protein n=1 Tax=Artemisia annua TaxID=35608 RepID=A0A2U1NVC0_ARTAN|nr:RNA-directed DNA polymerase, eukaryota, Reverse transcriptase zinc-binding domain protein [Artemisia annua]
MGISLDSLMSRKIYNGRHTSFWSDCWIDDQGPLEIRFPRLYALETYKTCSVADRWVSENGVWHSKRSWRRQPNGRATDELSNLSSLISGLVLNFSRDDEWTWSLEASGGFSVQSLSKLIQINMFAIEDSSLSFRWNSWAPRKINICAWRVSLNRLPKKDNLMRRGIALSLSVCLFCGKEEESRDHCFLLCLIIKIIWKKVWSWWKSPSLFCPSLDDILKGISSFSTTSWCQSFYTLYACLFYGTYGGGETRFCTHKPKTRRHQFVTRIFSLHFKGCHSFGHQIGLLSTGSYGTIGFRVLVF